jgi:hypothetical protein
MDRSRERRRAIAFVLVFGLPLLVANAIIMSFILTNHSLSPHTVVNDPLANSLSLALPRFFDAGELGVEVRRLWPERYQCLPYFTALRLLHDSPRVYRTSTLLFDPQTGRDCPALLPRGIEASPRADESATPQPSHALVPPRPSPANLLAVSSAASVACSAPAPTK